MATGTVYIDAEMRDAQGNIVVFGRMLLGHDARVLSQDLKMHTIRSLVLNPQHIDRHLMVAGSIGSQGAKDYRRGFVSAVGSLSRTTGTNSVRIRTYRLQTYGSMGIRGTLGVTTRNGGTAVLRHGVYFGTQAGSIRFTFMAAGHGG